MPTPPAVTKKAAREAQRAAQRAEFQRKQKVAKRNRILGWSLGGTAALAIVGLVTTLLVIEANQPDPRTAAIEGLEEFDVDANHVQGLVDYEDLYGMNPPAGGNHNQAWLNCGVYTEPQQNENAVHSLEHGAIWITYDPALVTGDDLARLQDMTPSTYAILSPYADLPAPVVMSGWGAQVQLDGVDDPRFDTFVGRYWQSPDVPEPGAACFGAIDGPGLLS